MFGKFILNMEFICALLGGGAFFLVSQEYVRVVDPTLRFMIVINILVVFCIFGIAMSVLFHGMTKKSYFYRHAGCIKCCIFLSYQ